MLQQPANAVSEIWQRAIVAGAIERLVYKDGDGDFCTLTDDTLADALSLLVPIDDSDVGRVGILSLQAVSVQAPSSPAASAQQLTPTTFSGLTRLLQRSPVCHTSSAPASSHPSARWWQRRRVPQVLAQAENVPCIPCANCDMHPLMAVAHGCERFVRVASQTQATVGSSQDGSNASVETEDFQRSAGFNAHADSGEAPDRHCVQNDEAQHLYKQVAATALTSAEPSAISSALMPRDHPLTALERPGAAIHALEVFAEMVGNDACKDLMQSLLAGTNESLRAAAIVAVQKSRESATSLQRGATPSSGICEHEDMECTESSANGVAETAGDVRLVGNGPLNAPSTADESLEDMSSWTVV